MLSYNWGAQPLMLKIKQAMVNAGFRVWMDIDEITGSTLESMASAVENSVVVVIAMSKAYKESANCRLEAEYSVQQKKTVIPLMVDLGYHPDGWLGLLLGTKLYFDYSTATDDNQFNTVTGNLIRELHRSDHAASGVTSTSPSPTSPTASKALPMWPPKPTTTPAGTAAGVGLNGSNTVNPFSSSSSSLNLVLSEIRDLRKQNDILQQTVTELQKNQSIMQQLLTELVSRK